MIYNPVKCIILLYTIVPIVFAMPDDAHNNTNRYSMYYMYKMLSRSIQHKAKVQVFHILRPFPFSELACVLVEFESC